MRQGWDQGESHSSWLLSTVPWPGIPGAVSEEIGAAVDPEAKSSELAGN